jgi:hypothetical protein
MRKTKMKKTLLTIAILAASLITASAQMQGNLYVGGRLGYSTNTITAKYSYEGITLSGQLPGTSSFSIIPEVGYFVIDNLRVSFSAGYELSVQQTSQQQGKWLTDRTHLFEFGPSVSYYLNLLDDKLYYTPELGVYGAFGAFKQDLDLSTTKKYGVSAFALRINLIAFEYSINQNISAFATLGALEFDILAAQSDNPNDPKINASNLNFNILSSATAGVRYYF